MRNITCKKNRCNKNGLWFYTIAFLFRLILSLTRGMENHKVLRIIAGNFADLWYDYGRRFGWGFESSSTTANKFELPW